MDGKRHTLCRHPILATAIFQTNRIENFVTVHHQLFGEISYVAGTARGVRCTATTVSVLEHDVSCA